MDEPPTDTRAEEYAARLQALEGARWKRWLGVQAPYRWNLRRLDLGFTLDVNYGVGVDHNPHSVALVTPQEAGHRSDPSHVDFTDFDTLHRILADHRLLPERSFSFPFPRIAGRIFPFNEFVVVGRKAP